MNTPADLRKAIEEGIEYNVNYKNIEYDSMLENLWLIIFDSTTALKKISEKIDTRHLSESEFATLLIFTNCLVDTHSSYHSMRAGFHRAAAITSRGMLENLALAIAIKGDETGNIFKQYQAKRYHIPNAVGFGKKFFPEIGKLYGVLTNMFAHEPYEAIGRAFSERETTTVLHLVPPIERENFLIQFTLIMNLSTLMAMMGKVFEWAFANRFEPSIFWTLEGDKHIRVKAPPNAKALEEIAKIYTEKLKERNSDQPSNTNPGRR